MVNTKLSTAEEFDDARLILTLKTPGKVFINSAEESLHLDQTPTAKVNLDQVVDVTVSMQETKVDKSVHDLSLQQRKCILKDELNLPYFPGEPYSFSNCMKDCRIQQTIELCECLPPFYRSSSMANGTFCDVERLKCLKDQKILDISKCRHCQLACDFTMVSVESVNIQ